MVCLAVQCSEPPSSASIPALSSSRCQDNGSTRGRKRMQQSSIGAVAAKQPTSGGNKYSPFPSRTPLPPLFPKEGVTIIDPRPLRVVLPPANGARERSTPLLNSPASASASSLSPLSTTSSTTSSSSNDTDTHSNPASGGPAPSRLVTFHTHPPTPSHRQPPPSPSSPSPLQVYLYLYRNLPTVSSEVDYDRLARSMHGLQAGCFYYPDLDSSGARTMLRKAPEGTFLVRDSSDPKYLFAISVKTARGATSVRIQYYRGFFQLDCDDHMKRKLPRFETLLDLLDFHRTVYTEGQGGQYRWEEGGGASPTPRAPRRDMVIALTNPRRHSPPSLAHLTRVAVNRNLPDLHLPRCSTDRLPVPDSLKQFLRVYPFKV